LATPAPRGGNDLRQLGWTLAWAVVFCDIGTSVYYVPGILYGEVGNLAAVFIGIVTIGFLFLSQKSQEVAWRNPDGGGVVSMATKAFGPFIGALGGMLIIVDYFLTASISSVSGFNYLATVIPALEPHAMKLALVGLSMLCILNIIGIRESAAFSFTMASVAFIVNLVLVAVVAIQLTPEQWWTIWDQAREISGLDWRHTLIGFGGAWLAFSGLESISQVAPAMRLPLRKTAGRAMFAVVITMLLTGPVLAAFSIAALPEIVKETHSERFISQLGLQFGGIPMAWAVVASASTLLLFAANTAVIGAYHVVLALAKSNFLPRVLTRRNSSFGTPHLAIVLITLVPLGVIWFSRGDLSTLGGLYSFGLLGALTFENLSLDVVRLRERRFGAMTWIGLFTTFMVASAWLINIVYKWQATLFGGIVVSVGLLVALGIRKNWFILAVNRVPFIAEQAARQRARAEHLAMERGREIVSLETAEAARDLEPSRTLVALRDRNPRLIDEAVRRAKGSGDTSLLMIAVTEWPGLFSGEQARPEESLVEAIDEAAQQARDAGLTPIPIWRLSHNAARSISEAAMKLGADCVMLGVSKRTQLYHMLRGSVLKGLQRSLPEEGILIHTVG
jgi:amino acid transporter